MARDAAQEATSNPRVEAPHHPDDGASGRPQTPQAGRRRATDQDRELWARNRTSELATSKHELWWLAGLVSMSSFRIGLCPT